MGHPTPSRHTAWSPTPVPPFDRLRVNAERARDGFPRSVCPFYVTLGRCFTPGSLRVQSCAAWHARPGTFPFWACLCLLGHSQRRQDVPDDAYTPSSNILSIATCSAGSPRLARAYRLSLPLLTIDDRSHARGRCCLPCTEGTGVDVSHETCYHLTYVDTQLSKIKRPSPPIPRTASDFGRTGRTYRCT